LCGVKKVSKAILVGLAVLVALGVVLVVSLNLYIQSPGSQARIQEELSKALRLPLKLTTVSVSPFGGLHITGITIPNGGANFLEAASFNAHYQLGPLLQGKLVITDMDVETPKIMWVQAADGKWKLPAPEQAEKVAAQDANQRLAAEQGLPDTAAAKTEDKKPKEEVEKAAEKKSSFSVVVQRFEVKGGAVELFDKDSKHMAVFTDVNMVYTSLTPEHVEGTATIGKITWADSFTLENVTTPFKFAGGAFDLSEIAATFAGGTVQGKYHTHTEKDRSPYKAAVTFAKVDLDKLGAQMGTEPGQSTGTVGGQIEMRGDTHNDRMEGEGRIDLRDGQFHQLDLFQNIGQILGMRELSDLRVRDGHSELRMAGDKIYVEKLLLNTSDLQLAAKGIVRTDKRLNLDAQLSVEEAAAQHLPGMIRDSFVPAEGGRRAVPFNVTGTTDKPKTNLLDKLMGAKINTQFGDVLGSLFGNGDKAKQDSDKTKPDDKKKKKDKDKDRAAQNGATPPASTPAPATPQPQPQPAVPNP